MSNEKDKQSSFCICVIPVCLRANGMYTSSLCPIQQERLGRMGRTLLSSKITGKEKKLSLDMHTVSAFMFIALYMPKDSNELFELY